MIISHLQHTNFSTLVFFSLCSFLHCSYVPVHVHALQPSCILPRGTRGCHPRGPALPAWGPHPPPGAGPGDVPHTTLPQPRPGEQHLRRQRCSEPTIDVGTLSELPKGCRDVWVSFFVGNRYGLGGWLGGGVAEKYWRMDRGGRTILHLLGIVEYYTILSTIFIFLESQSLPTALAATNADATTLCGYPPPILSGLTSQMVVGNDPMPSVESARGGARSSKAKKNHDPRSVEAPFEIKASSQPTGKQTSNQKASYKLLPNECVPNSCRTDGLAFP